MMTLYLVIPCYNEEAVLPETSKRLLKKINDLMDHQAISPQSRILFVDDGSHDNTWQMIDALSQQNERFAGVKLSRNRGHQNALLAGLTVALERCDAAISLDADLQDDIEAIDAMVERFAAGCDIVYGVRSSRTSDSFFKRTTAEGFYRFMRALGVDIVDNHADYRLMSHRALEALMQYEESNLFLRGIVPLIGYKTDIVTYERHERFAGESKYPMKKMLSFAFDGITSFSVKPIRLITSAGVLIFGASVIALFVLLILKLRGITVQGWTTLMGSIWMLGGIQLLALGIIGEYIGKIYKETKRRPRFLVDCITLR
ncbi:MAG: glycosyltransferase family 2 protein [Oscillospiraceae bacterium]